MTSREQEILQAAMAVAEAGRESRAAFNEWDEARRSLRAAATAAEDRCDRATEVLRRAERKLLEIALDASEPARGREFI
jgi:hypothetical protein